MQSARFTVIAKTGYDFGHLTPRARSVLGEFDHLAEARAARDAYEASKLNTNDGAAFEYAEIIDRDDEHAVVGFGCYGDGQRITGVRPVIAVASADDVLFRGTRQQCEAFRA